MQTKILEYFYELKINKNHSIHVFPYMLNHIVVFKNFFINRPFPVIIQAEQEDFYKQFCTEKKIAIALTAFKWDIGQINCINEDTSWLTSFPLIIFSFINVDVTSQLCKYLLWSKFPRFKLGSNDPRLGVRISQ